MLRLTGAGAPLSNPHWRYPSRRRPPRETLVAMDSTGCLLRLRSLRVVRLVPLGVPVMTVRIRMRTNPTCAPEPARRRSRQRQQVWEELFERGVYGEGALRCQRPQLSELGEQTWAGRVPFLAPIRHASPLPQTCRMNSSVDHPASSCNSRHQGDAWRTTGRMTLPVAPMEGMAMGVPGGRRQRRADPRPA